MDPPVRAIVRYSFNGDAAAARRKMRAALQGLEGGGFWQIGTATFEIKPTEENPEPDIPKALEEVAQVIREGDAVLDHLWVYVDRPENPGGTEP